MWNSLAFVQGVASWAFVVGIVAGTVALAAGAVTTVASNRIADLSERIRKSETEAANVRIAEANARALEATARAEEARADAAKVSERLKESEKVRSLSREKAEALRGLLTSDLFQKDPKPRLRVASVSDAEAQMYAMEFLTLFKSCGVNIYPTPDGTLPNKCTQVAPSWTGLAMQVRSFEVSEAMQPFAHFEQLMDDIGLPLTVCVGGNLKPNEAVLNILRKPPPAEDDSLHVQEG